MLSANGGELPALEQPASTPNALAPAVIESLSERLLGTRDQQLAISAIHFLIDGEKVTLNSLDQPLRMNVGSSLEVVGIEYRLNGDEIVSGKIAFEAYLNKLKGSRVRTDYSDGRFGGHIQEGDLPDGSATHPGLEGKWEMQAGTESITLVMVRYGTDEVVVEDRVTIQTQVGTPDFVISPEIKIKAPKQGAVVGKQIKIYGSWGNQGEGTYRNYAEVDIYHESDPNKIVWSGSLADVVESGEFDKGQFVNKIRRDGYARNWAPDLGGTYTLKFYSDPENRWAESDETNNVTTMKLEVSDPRLVDRGIDSVKGRHSNHHSIDGDAARDAVFSLDPGQVEMERTTATLARSVAQQVDAQHVPKESQTLSSGSFVETGTRSEELTTPTDSLRNPSSEEQWPEAFDLALQLNVSWGEV